MWIVAPKSDYVTERDTLTRREWAARRLDSTQYLCYTLFVPGDIHPYPVEKHDPVEGYLVYRHVYPSATTVESLSKSCQRFDTRAEAAKYINSALMYATEAGWIVLDEKSQRPVVKISKERALSVNLDLACKWIFCGPDREMMMMMMMYDPKMDDCCIFRRVWDDDAKDFRSMNINWEFFSAGDAQRALLQNIGEELDAGFWKLVDVFVCEGISSESLGVKG